MTQGAWKYRPPSSSWPDDVGGAVVVFDEIFPARTASAIVTRRSLRSSVSVHSNRTIGWVSSWTMSPGFDQQWLRRRESAQGDAHAVTSNRLFAPRRRWLAEGAVDTVAPGDGQGDRSEVERRRRAGVAYPEGQRRGDGRRRCREGSFLVVVIGGFFQGVVEKVRAAGQR